MFPRFRDYALILTGALIVSSNPQAFVVIGEAYEALGEGFKPLKPS
ncbi:MAG TPA: hypothetical protein VIK33_12400 [Anaerolineae bacterium]